MTEPKRIGRPRSTDPWRTVGVRFRQSDLDVITKAAGDITLSEWVRGIVLGTSRHAVKAKPVPVSPAVGRIERGLGPQRAEPGSRLKKG